MVGQILGFDVWIGETKILWLPWDISEDKEDLECYILVKGTVQVRLYHTLYEIGGQMWVLVYLLRECTPHCRSVATRILLQISKTMMHKHMNKGGLLYIVLFLMIRFISVQGWLIAK